ncbi:mitochondrial import receptor subunit TOM70-like isoform X2 [Paramacrobiotus metropolitanus]|uniref:mitochondrial import receptor subunit TOM70-like isoform X2 n=1 Tax=Paramacrobiotus metropolitanus TaxID=2943436 RepID=UPI002445A2A2|nr:mitochondrial import receptor subunit TOM70-like isoform X2 [Paramacrobiotus metropolitanus]
MPPPAHPAAYPFTPSPPLETPTFLTASPTWQLSSPATWPKWAIALLIGVPVTAAAAYLYLHRQPPRSRPNGRTPSDRVDRGKTRAYHPRSAGDAPSQTGLDAEKGGRPLSEPKTVAERLNALKNQGNALFRDKRFLEAKKKYSEAVELAWAFRENKEVKEDLAQSFQNRAACNESLKLFEDVVSDCTEALQLDNHYAKAYARRSRGHERCGNLLQAVYDLVAAAILTNFKIEEYRERSEKLMVQLAVKMAKDEMRRRSSEGHTPKLSKVFVRQFNQGFSQDPIQIAVKNMDSKSTKKALEAWSRHRYDAVLEECEKVVAEASALGTRDDLNLALLLRATLQFLMGHIHDAKVDFNRVINAHDASTAEKTNAKIKMACIHLQENNPEQCLAVLNEALSSDPTCPDTYFHRAQVHMLVNNMEDCLTDFRQCSTLNGGCDPVAAFHVAHIEYRLHVLQEPADQQRALRILEETVCKNIKSVDAYTLVAQLYMELQEFDKAEQLLKQALSKTSDPHNAVVYTQLGLVECVARENRDACIVLLTKAMEADEHYTPAIEMLMDMELQAGNLREARVLYERCLDLAKSEAEMMPLIQAYQVGEAGQIVHEQLGLAVKSPAGGAVGAAHPGF